MRIFTKLVSLDFQKLFIYKNETNVLYTVYQNERREDWNPESKKLKHLIKDYRDEILRYHKEHTCPNMNVPECYLSKSAEGNFLETLNLSSK